MKKLFLIIPILLLLSGCSSDWERRVVYRPSYWSFDTMIIDLEDSHILNQGHSYDIIETENGYDLVLHFIEANE